MNRYKVVDGSNSNHCCFQASVIDTEQFTVYQSGDIYYEAVCECTDEKDAQRICDALNACEAKP